MTGTDNSEKQPAGLYQQPVLTLEPGTHTAPIGGAGVDAIGAYVVTGSDDKTVRIWEMGKGALLSTIGLPRGSPGACITPGSFL